MYSDTYWNDASRFQESNIEKNTEGLEGRILNKVVDEKNKDL